MLLNCLFMTSQAGTTITLLLTSADVKRWLLEELAMFDSLPHNPDF